MRRFLTAVVTVMVGLLTIVARAELPLTDVLPSTACDAAKQDSREETKDQSQARHARIAERRKGDVVICHRGAVEFAHENTLEAYRASLELGADGNEIDIRGTRDGVLVCFHDDMLDSILDAYGDVSDFTWEQLRTFPFRHPGPMGRHCRIPKLSEVFELHRRHAGLIHLDVKRPGLDKAIAQMLGEMDMWDHIMAANTNCEAVTSDARYRSLAYKASLYLDRTDVDVRVIAEKQKQPGAWMVEDPRGVLIALGRKISAPSSDPVAPQPEPTRPKAPEGELTVQQLLDRLGDDADWNQIAKTEEEQLESGKRITARARAADELARRGVKTQEVFELLARRVRHRSLHKNWRFHGLDGSAAMRALIRLQAPGAIELARFSLWLDEPVQEVVLDPQYKTPRSWVDFRVKMTAFRELEWFPGAATEQLCCDYLALEESAARVLGPLQFESAARTLLASRPDRATVLSLLKSPRSDVRGRAVLYCIASGRAAWTRELLQEYAPDAVSYCLPSAANP